MNLMNKNVMFKTIFQSLLMHNYLKMGGYHVLLRSNKPNTLKVKIIINSSKCFQIVISI